MQELQKNLASRYDNNLETSTCIASSPSLLSFSNWFLCFLIFLDGCLNWWTMGTSNLIVDSLKRLAVENENGWNVHVCACHGWTLEIQHHASFSENSTVVLFSTLNPKNNPVFPWLVAHVPAPAKASMAKGSRRPRISHARRVRQRKTKRPTGKILRISTL